MEGVDTHPLFPVVGVLVTIVVADPGPKLTVTVSLPVRATVQEEVAMEVQPVHEVRWEPSLGRAFKMTVEPA